MVDLNMSGTLPWVTAAGVSIAAVGATAAGIASIITNLRLADLRQAVVDIKDAQIAHLERLTYKSVYDQIAAQKALYENQIDLLNTQLEETAASHEQRVKLEHDVDELRSRITDLTEAATVLASNLSWAPVGIADLMDSALVEELLKKVLAKHPDVRERLRRQGLWGASSSLYGDLPNENDSLRGNP